MQTTFRPDVRSFGALYRMEIKLKNGYTYKFNDVFDFDAEPFVGLDIYDKIDIPLRYMCVIDGQYLKSIIWNEETDDIWVEGHLGKKVKVVLSIEENEINIVDA